MFNSDNISIVLEVKNAQVSFAEKIISFQKQEHLIQYCCCVKYLLNKHTFCILIDYILVKCQVFIEKTYLLYSHWLYPREVSSIEFDKDQEFFAIAGVTKRIKIYDYNVVLKVLIYLKMSLKSSFSFFLSFNWYLCEKLSKKREKNPVWP